MQLSLPMFLFFHVDLKYCSVSFHFSQNSFQHFLQSRSISSLRVYVGMISFLQLGGIVLLDTELLVILGCQGYRNKIPQAGQLKQQKGILLPALEAISPRSKCQAGLVLGEASLLSLQTTPSHYVLTCLFSVCACPETGLWHFYQIRAHPYDVIYSLTKMKHFFFFLLRVTLLVVNFSLDSRNPP